MSKIISIATAVPKNKYTQQELFLFADKLFSSTEDETRKLKYLYNHSGITNRYSVIEDFSSAPDKRSFFPPTDDLEPFPSIEKRMQLFTKFATPLSVNAIQDCIQDRIVKNEITHLITVSCTGISAPGLDLQIIETMDLPSNITRTAVNFMGCYAAVHALKLADAFCSNNEGANVIVVCTELCTLHFQKTVSIDNLTASLLFGDGCAAMLVQNDNSKQNGIRVKSFFSDVSFKGKNEMAWEVSSKGFLMTLTGYVPALIKEDFKALVMKAMAVENGLIEAITHWCIHPGGKQILQSISSSLELNQDRLKYSYEVLNDFGNMSSATILFVLKKILEECNAQPPQHSPLIFGAAFGPGLTMETFVATYA
ncbi:MAG: type III polyketide synthase [Ferruginibacter sp.]|nr:type III polyketide synthase [Ferruginibacter sp.]